MHAIASTLKLNDSGDQVANLQAALLFLLDRDVTQFFDPPPTPDEFKGIREALLAEMSNKRFGKATLALTAAFQLQQRLGTPSLVVIRWNRELIEQRPIQ